MTQEQAATTLGQFRVWLGAAPPGDTVAYYIGFLAQARGLYPDHKLSEAMVLAKEAWAAYEAGLVELVQVRKWSGRYVYLAVKRRWRRKV